MCNINVQCAQAFRRLKLIEYVELSDGRSGYFDMKPYLEKGVFTELKDKNCFKQAKPFLCGIAWPNEQDLSADTIAYDLKTKPCDFEIITDPALCS